MSAIHNMYFHEKISYQEYLEKSPDEETSLFEKEASSKMEIIKSNILIKYSPSY